MALNALIRGPGPDYTLPGEAPTDGQTFQANAEGLVVWGDAAATEADIAALNQRITDVEVSTAASIAATEGTVSALESKVGTIDDEVQVNETAIAANVEAIAGLATEVSDLRADVDFLLSQQPNPPKYIFLNGTGGYLNFATGGGDYLDFTKSWSVGIRLEGLPDNAPDDHPLSCFGSGKVSLTLKRSSAPLVGNWG